MVSTSHAAIHHIHHIVLLDLRLSDNDAAGRIRQARVGGRAERRVKTGGVLRRHRTVHRLEITAGERRVRAGARVGLHRVRVCVSAARV